MRILMTANSMWNIWNFRKDLVIWLISKNYEVYILAPKDKSMHNLEELGCKTFDLKMDSRGVNPIKDILLIYNFFEKLRKVKPDYIFSFTIKNNIYCGIAARFLKVNFIPNITGIGAAFLSSWFLRQLAIKLYQFSFRDLKTCFFQNKDDANLFTERKILLDKQVQILPGSGINLNEFSFCKLDHSKISFLMIARLLTEKGIYEFIEAADIIKSKYPEIKFNLLGAISTNSKDGLKKNELKKLIKKGTINYYSPQECITPFIREATAVVLPSYREGAPRVLIEASSMGRPCITTDVPGCNSVVENNITGFLCEPRNSSSLADKMEKFINLSAEKKEALALSARKKMEREFNVEQIIESYCEVLHNVTTKYYTEV